MVELDDGKKKESGGRKKNGEEVSGKEGEKKEWGGDSDGMRIYTADIPFSLPPGHGSASISTKGSFPTLCSKLFNKRLAEPIPPHCHFSIVWDR